MASSALTHSVAFVDLLRAFTRIGLLSFGGPAGQIALMHRELVEERKWVAEEDFLHALNFCHLLPGPEAQQLATWIGWRLHGWRGGLAAGLLFVIPGAAIILALSVLYAIAANLAWVEALFLGVKAAVLAIVVQALLRIAGRALDTGLKRALAVAAFVGLFLFDLPFPLIVLGSGVIGMAVAAWRPALLALKPTAPAGDLPERPWRSTIISVALWGAVWAAPMVLIALTLGQDHVLWEIGVFFSQLAIVTFGGAYAVLAYMAQEAVQGFGWLRPGEMADGLGLAETTPGPLILVTQFVGYLAAFRAPEPFSPFLAGLLGAGLTTWVTFAPCFMWIFAFAPWIDRLGNAVRLKGGLAAVTAAVVGVIANLTAWFALHVLFAEVGQRQFGPLRLYWPDPASFEWRAGVLAALACALVFGLKWSVLRVLMAAALGGMVLVLAI
ncbi:MULTISPECIES: chromate efflux transporter [Sphingomonadales]|uniref:chromate efflux transporter n=1 Tax=Sphingomonadales TaxID=204457 RepID=UPI000833876A|nr:MULTISPECIES: chromate efflux transporter [Sphingomonadales]MDK2759105.1 chromate efflux transporter [Blastomonas fulva]